MADPVLTRLRGTKPVAATSPQDHVVLLDPSGMPTGSAVKRDVHHADTPFHLAVSCYVVRDDGSVLLTRRAPGKTFAGLWTNACCGHPRPDEELDQAVRRHLAHELGAEPLRLRLALADFTYRAVAGNGVVEHELCPVFVAEVGDTPLSLNPIEADDFEWVPWSNLVRRAEDEPGSLSPWCVSQISRLAALSDEPIVWVRSRPTAAKFARATGDGRPDPFRRMGTDVEVAIEQFLGRANTHLGILDPLSTELTEPIARLYRAGGKRLRPCLVYCGHAAASAPSSTDRRNVAHLGAAVEMLHTFALLHDDVMDRSELRRGQPTAHTWFARVHERDEHPTPGRDGGQWFGNSAAIVAGDLAFVWADELLDCLDIDDSLFRRIRGVFDLLRREVIAGQYLDLRLSSHSATDRQALSVALLKSARYTVTRPLQLGATLAGVDEKAIAALCAYGDAVGIAFQLRDDVLGVFGDPIVTGKGNAEDLRSGKASLLLVRALELASPNDLSVLQGCLGVEDLDDASVDRCRAAVLSSGAVASIEALIASLLETAMGALVELRADVAADLAELADLLAYRAT
jgi:geranylgeranyl diphosphate synthase, type I